MKQIFQILSVLTILSGCNYEINDEHLEINLEKTMLEDYWIKNIAFDADGTAWLGTVDNGIICVRNNQFTFYNSENSGFPDTTWISDMEIDSKGNLWIAHQGLTKFDGIQFTNCCDEIADIPIIDIEIDGTDKLWLALSSYELGCLATYDEENGLQFPEDSIGFEVKHINSLALDSNDNLWIAGYDYVNFTFLFKSSKNGWIRYGEEDLGFNPYWIRDIDIDSKDRVWGLIDYSLSSMIITNQPVVFNYDGKDCSTYNSADTTLSFSFTTGIAIDNCDRVWTLLHNSIEILSNDNWEAAYEAPEELSFFTIEHSKNGEAWVGTNNGVLIFSLETQ